jgi:hypothetical protein
MTPARSAPRVLRKDKAIADLREQPPINSLLRTPVKATSVHRRENLLR